MRKTTVSQFDSIIAIVAGIGMIALSFSIKKFYAAKGIYGVALSDKPIATWKGRILFIVVGLVLLSFGIKFLVYG